jgi:glycosyltransferase involved in cell wall biosynthesis
MISYCCIFRQEDKRFLTGMLNTIPAGSEVILCETLNTLQEESDSLIDINTENPKDLTIKHVQYKYNNYSFAEARNICQKYATMDWILFIDADERVIIEEEDYKNIAMVPANIGGLYVHIANSFKYENNISANIIELCRLYRNNKEFFWVNHIHEKIEPSILDAGFFLGKSTILIKHIGYFADKNVLLEKFNRNAYMSYRQLYEGCYNEECRVFLETKLLGTLQEKYKLESSNDNRIK